MEGTVLARIAAIVFVAIAITATVIEITRDDDPVPVSSAPSLQPSADPLRERQRQCQRMGEAAASDPECLHIWAETRDRFLGRAPEPTTPAPSRGQ